MVSNFAVFRCDASLEIGSGHIMRCLTLARALRKRGVESVFLCRPAVGDLIAVLEAEFRVLTLPRFSRVSCKSDPASMSIGSSLYAEWLGCTQEQDWKDSLAALLDLPDKSISWLIVDHYGLSAEWQNSMQEGLHKMNGSAPRLLVLDDLADRAHQADVLLDANRFDSEKTDEYFDLVPESCNTLLGPYFALLDPTYPLLQSCIPLRSHLKRVLVFFGGMDSDNYCSVALRALSDERLSHLDVDVVIGPAAPHRAELEALTLKRANTTLHVDLPSLAGLMVRADLALGAAGTTSWERACLALPSLVVPVAENQEQVAKALENAGAARCLRFSSGTNPVSSMVMALVDLLNCPDALMKMSHACLEIGDGRGLARVVTILLGPVPRLRLRPALPSDLWLYYWWASDLQVRSNSFNSDQIPQKHHRRWFAARLRSVNAMLRVLEDGNGLPIGQIRFERSTGGDNRAVIAFSLDRIVRGKGFASQLLELGLLELARLWGNEYEVYGEVRADNEASCLAFCDLVSMSIPLQSRW